MLETTKGDDMKDLLVTVDYYAVNDNLIVFVGGYGLNKASCTMIAANKLAKQCGQKTIKVTRYFENQLPEIKDEPVY